jgi:hypothetical protein
MNVNRYAEALSHWRHSRQPGPPSQAQAPQARAQMAGPVVVTGVVARQAARQQAEDRASAAGYVRWRVSPQGRAVYRAYSKSRRAIERGSRARRTR